MGEPEAFRTFRQVCPLSAVGWGGILSNHPLLYLALRLARVLRLADSMIFFTVS